MQEKRGGLMEQLGELVDKTRQIISICGEEYANHRKRIRELENKKKVLIIIKEEVAMMVCEKHYPKEKNKKYIFDMGEWESEEPSARTLKNIPKLYEKSWNKMETAIKKRCALLDVEIIESHTEFSVDENTTLSTFNFLEKDWREFSLEKRGD
jgi:hypothetical protein